MFGRMNLRSLALASFLLLASEKAFAQSATVDATDFGRKPISVTAAMGFASNSIGFGLGARVGYLVAERIYVGATVHIHLPTGGTVIPMTIQGGYDVPVGPVRIRPYGAFGFVIYSGGIGTYALLQFGAELIYPIPSTDFFVGIDPFRIQLPLVSGASATWSGYLLAGMRFGGS